jgi:outer membrane protein TolC
VVEVSRRARVTAEAHYSFAHQRFAGGYGNRVDEVRAAEEVASDQAQLEAAEAQLTRLRESLGVLLAVDCPIDATDEVALPAPPTLADAAAGSQLDRADVRLLRGQLAVAERLRKDGWTDYLPTMLGTFAPFIQDPPTLTLPQAGWQAQLSLSWTLYDGGLRYGLQKERRAVTEEARLNLENGLRQATSQVRAADDEVKRSNSALAAARAAARLAGEALQLTNLGYQAGAQTNIEVIDAERRARDADTAVTVAEDAWRQALLDLLIAAGRFPG